MKENDKINIERKKEMMISPLRTIAFFTTIAGIIALFFEMYFYKSFSLQIYIGRIAASLIGLIVFGVTFTKFGKNHPFFFVHFLLISIILSFSSIIIFIPKTLFINAQLMALVIFLASLFLSWELKHQIILSIYYNLLFAASILMNDKSIFFLPNMYALVIFVMLISVMGIVVSALNYKIRKNSELISIKLEMTEQRYKDIFDSAAFGIFQIDENGEILDFNNQFLSILKYEKSDEILEKKIPVDFFDNINDYENLLKLLEKKHEVNNYKVLFIGKEEKIWTKINIRKIIDKNGNLKFYNASIQDISEQMLFENELQKTNDALILSKEKSEQTMRKMIKYSQSRSKFLAKINHEIRTPVNTIVGYLALIEEGIYEDEDDLHKIVKEAKASSDSLMEIINHNLDIYNIENKKLLLDKNPFYLREEIEKAIALIKPLTRKDVQLIYKIEDRIPEEIIGDETRIRQILINLLQNSAKFTEKGKIRLSVKLENLRSDWVEIGFRVTDSGKGIPSSKLTQLLTKDYQLDDEDLKSKGTGLGLQICREIIEMMKGKLEIQSVEGKGTVVDFKIKFQIPVKENQTIVVEGKNDESKQTDEEILAKAKIIMEKRNVFKEEGRSEKLEVDENSINLKKYEIVKKSEKNENTVQNKQIKEYEHEIEVIEKDDLNTEILINNKADLENDLDKKEKESVDKLINKDEDKRPKAGQKSILLVEDNYSNQQMELKVLTELGYFVNAVSSGFEAIEQIKKNKFDLILMDIVMPEMDGVETSIKIRELNELGKKIPIIAVTAHASVEDRKRCIENGMNDYVSKPIKIQFLKMIIDEWLYRWK